MPLSDLLLKTSYHKGEDNIADDFYLPCMSQAESYDRAVGYFRSTIFLLAWPSLRQFVQAGGRMRVLCSQVLSDVDVEALREGYAGRVNSEIGARLEAEIESMLAEDDLRSPTRVLAALVSLGVIEIKIAILSRNDLSTVKGRIFHDKLGIFTDSSGNTVTFKGSMNETWAGLSPDGNLESVDIAASWMGERDRERGANEVRYFDDLWNERYPGVDVRPFPQVALDKLQLNSAPDWEESLEIQLLADRTRPAVDFKGRVLKSHQSAGLAAWHANDRRGILAFATGSGKTFTALTAIRDAIEHRSEPTLVIVPDKTLFSQWLGELRSGLKDLDVAILRAGAGNSRWREGLALWTRPDERRRLVLATVQTASSADFLDRIAGGSHLFLVADEVHRLGAPKRRAILRSETFGARLGLSATPERAGDPEGTAALLAFFDRVLEPRYSLSDAVRDGVLCKYFYRPHPVELDHSELDDWQQLTTQINQLWARRQTGDTSEITHNRLERLVFQRARIVKQAAAKVPLALRVITDNYERGQRWIVYCDDIDQLDRVMAVLQAADLTPMPYHSQMSGDREGTLRWLNTQGGVVVSIKCLDEGVDIPSVTHALILASSKNPREFIQRRGRVLRTAPGKTLAYIHDAIVLPGAAGPSGERETDRISMGEVARASRVRRTRRKPSGSNRTEACSDCSRTVLG